MPVPALVLPVLLASVVTLTACDRGVGDGVTEGDAPEVEQVCLRLASRPRFWGAGVDFVVGWELDCGADIAGLELGPDGESVTFGAWQTAVTVNVDTPEDWFDWGFSDYTYVAGAGLVNGEPLSLALGPRDGRLGAHLLHHVDGTREDLVYDDAIVSASLAPSGAIALTMGRRCLVHVAAGVQRLPDDACWANHEVTGAGGLAWVGGHGGLWRVDANGPRAFEVFGSRLLWHPEAQVLVVAGGAYLDGEEVILGLNRDGEQIWSRETRGYHADLALLPGGVVAVADTNSTDSRVRFLDAATGEDVREPLGVVGWSIQIAVSADGRRLAMIVYGRLLVFQIAD